MKRRHENNQFQAKPHDRLIYKLVGEELIIINDEDFAKMRTLDKAMREDSDNRTNGSRRNLHHNKRLENNKVYKLSKNRFRNKGKKVKKNVK